MNEFNLRMTIVVTLKLYHTRLGVIVMNIDGASWTQRLSGVIFLSSEASQHFKAKTDSQLLFI